LGASAVADPGKFSSVCIFFPDLPIESQRQSVISLKRHIDAWDEKFRVGLISAYRSLLASVAASSKRAVPDLGKDLENRFSALDLELSDSLTLEKLDEATRQVELEFSVWADKANTRHEENRREIKEIVTGMTTFAETFAKQGQTAGRELTELTRRMHSVAELGDLAAMRKSILESTVALTHCAQRITDEGSASLARLAMEIEGYRSRLKITEKLSLIDPLTGLANRRRFDGLLTALVLAGRPFSLILMDVNNFKRINDEFGHLAGDAVLKQFASELRRQFQQAEIVARWGGDEFAVILGSGLNDVEARMARFRRSIADYKINSLNGTVKMPVDATFGIVEWDGRESGPELLARADQQMYKGKDRRAVSTT